MNRSTIKLILVDPNYALSTAFRSGIGRISPDEAARQMALAYDHFIYPPKFLNCFVAASRQLQIWEDNS